MHYQKVDDNTIKENVTVTSSNFSRNDGTIRILTVSMARYVSQNGLTIGGLSGNKQSICREHSFLWADV